MGLTRVYHGGTLSINLDPVKTSTGSDHKIVTAAFYWRGRYITFCHDCRLTHPALHSIPDHELVKEQAFEADQVRLCALEREFNPHRLVTVEFDAEQ